MFSVLTSEMEATTNDKTLMAPMIKITWCVESVDAHHWTVNPAKPARVCQTMKQPSYKRRNKGVPTG